jgi:hypothetical protein
VFCGGALMAYTAKKKEKKRKKKKKKKGVWITQWYLFAAACQQRRNSNEVVGETMQLNQFSLHNLRIEIKP